MIEVKKEGIFLTRTDLEFENEGVLNPAVIREGDNVHLFYRAVQHGNHSTIGYCRLTGPLTLAERWDKPILVPEFDYESHGVEDPRIVKIDDLYYMTYTAQKLRARCTKNITGTKSSTTRSLTRKKRSCYGTKM
jgi:predicted GH43/DUF377 family glycosyl hydrolase